MACEREKRLNDAKAIKMKAAEEKNTTDYRIIVTAFWDGILSPSNLRNNNIKSHSSAIVFAFCLLALLIFNLCFKKDDKEATNEKINKDELIQGLNII